MTIIPSNDPIPEGFSYRQGKKEDAGSIIELVHTVLIEYGLIPEPNGVDKDLADVETSYNNGYFGVIKENEKIVATYGLFHLDDHAVEIRKMYAAIGARGKGLGKWMVNHLIQIARHNGYKIIELETASALKEAIRLYEKMGFQEKDFENKTPRCDKSFYMNI